MVEQVGAYLDAGLDGLTLAIRDLHDPEPVALIGEALTKAFGARQPVG